MKYIQTKNALKANGHYSQAVAYNGILYLSGILPFDRLTGQFIDSTIKIQMAEVLNNLDSILKEAGTDRNHILKTTLYISNIELWEEVNHIYGEYFGSHRPARSIVPTGRLHFDSKIEMEAIAALAE